MRRVVQYQFKAEPPPMRPPLPLVAWDSGGAVVGRRPSRFLDAMGQQFPTAVTPRGYEAVSPAAARRQPPALFTADVFAQAAQVPTIYLVVASVASDLLSLSRRSVGADQFPISAQVAAPSAWVVSADPARQQKSVRPEVSLVQPAAASYLAWIAIPELRPLGRLPLSAVDLPVQQVPTTFVPNGWVALWDGPPRQRFAPALQRADQPVLAAYQSVIITYPDGWQAIFPALPQQAKPGRGVEIIAQLIVSIAPQGWSISAEPRFVEHFPGGASTDVTNPPVRPVWGWEARADVQPRRPRATEAPAIFIVPALIFRAWGFAEQVQPRAKIEGSIVTLVSPILITPQGFGVTFSEPIRARFLQRSAEITSFPAAAASPSGFSVVDGLPPRKLKTPASEPLNAIGRFIGTPIGVTALWGFADWHFRVIRPAPPDFGRMWPKIGFRIASQPTLLGTDQRPTMDGTDAPPTLLGTDAQAGLDGTKATPTLTGTKAQPDLEGDV